MKDTIRSILALLGSKGSAAAKQAAGTPGQRHRYALAHDCASNPFRNASRKVFRELRRKGVRVRRPADLRPHFAARARELTEYLNRPVVVEHEGTVQA